MIREGIEHFALCPFLIERSSKMEITPMWFLSLIITFVMSATITRICGKLFDMQDEKNKRDEALNNLLEEWQNFKAWQEKIEKKMEVYEKASVNLKNGGMALVRDRFLQSARHFCKEGYITFTARENLDKMYEAYRILGGNGVVKHWHEKIERLEVRDDDYIVPRLNIYTERKNDEQLHSY